MKRECPECEGVLVCAPSCSLQKHPRADFYGTLPTGAERRARGLQLLAEGRTTAQVAKAVGVNFYTVQGWDREHRRKVEGIDSTTAAPACDVGTCRRRTTQRCRLCACVCCWVHQPKPEAQRCDHAHHARDKSRSTRKAAA